jgi:hypothetical protein
MLLNPHHRPYGNPVQKIGIIPDLSNADVALAKIFPVLVYFPWQ